MAGALAEDDFPHKLQRSSFTGPRVLQRQTLSIDDCALYPLFSDEVIALMHRLIPIERHGRVAMPVVVKARLAASVEDEGVGMGDALQFGDGPQDRVRNHASLTDLTERRD